MFHWFWYFRDCLAAFWGNFSRPRANFRVFFLLDSLTSRIFIETCYARCKDFCRVAWFFLNFPLKHVERQTIFISFRDEIILTYSRIVKKSVKHQHHIKFTFSSWFQLSATDFTDHEQQRERMTKRKMKKQILENHLFISSFSNLLK